MNIPRESPRVNLTPESNPNLPNPQDDGWQGQMVEFSSDGVNSSDVPIYTVTNHNDQPERVANRGVTVVFSPWSDGPYKRLMQQRAGVIAQATGDNVMVVGSPGVETQAKPMPAYMRRGLRHGESGLVHRAMWHGVEAGLDQFGQSFSAAKLRFHGCSKGAWDATAMAAVSPDGVRIDQVDLWESAHLDRRKGYLGIMATYLRHGADNWKKEIEQNPAWVERPDTTKLVAEQLMRRPSGLLIYPKAMASGPAPEIGLFKARQRDIIDGDTVITVLNGEASHVSPSGLNDRFADMLADHAFKAVRILAVGPNHHSFNDNLGKVDSIHKQVQRLTTGL